MGVDVIAFGGLEVAINAPVNFTEFESVVISEQLGQCATVTIKGHLASSAGGNNVAEEADAQDYISSLDTIFENNNRSYSDEVVVTLDGDQVFNGFIVSANPIFAARDVSFEITAVSYLKIMDLFTSVIYSRLADRRYENAVEYGASMQSLLFSVFRDILFQLPSTDTGSYTEDEYSIIQETHARNEEPSNIIASVLNNVSATGWDAALGASASVKQKSALNLEMLMKASSKNGFFSAIQALSTNLGLVFLDRGAGIPNQGFLVALDLLVDGTAGNNSLGGDIIEGITMSRTRTKPPPAEVVVTKHMKNRRYENTAGGALFGAPVVARYREDGSGPVAPVGGPAWWPNANYTSGSGSSGGIPNLDDLTTANQGSQQSYGRILDSTFTALQYWAKLNYYRMAKNQIQCQVNLIRPDASKIGDRLTVSYQGASLSGVLSSKRISVQTGINAADFRVAYGLSFVRG